MDNPSLVIAGLLRRQYTLLPNGKVLLDVPGGNLLYAAAGARLWSAESIGLLARVSADYPQEWIDSWEKYNLNTSGIRRLNTTFDQRYFLAYSDLQTRHTDNPIHHFSQRGLPIPPKLLKYQDPTPLLDSRTALHPESIRQNDVPASFWDTRAVYICPMDYLTHNLLPALFRQKGAHTVVLSPPSGYMTPVFWDQIPSVVTGLSAFLTSENKIRALFHERSNDLWEMAEALAAYGCEIIIIKRGLGGQWVYDARSKKRWEIPAYPSQEVDPTGVGDSFGGGFLAGYLKTFDPVEAALHGNVAASLTIEGWEPFYALDALPGLAQARLEALHAKVLRL
ncbi:MAG: carbohydrate kinase family protein [Anaerolineales bacterium]